MERVPMTQAGFEKLEAELKHLKSVERPAIIEAISEARAHGDLSENAEYHAAKEKQSFNEGRIQELEGVISVAQIIDVKSLSGDTVKFGATVVVADCDTDEEHTYQIVGQYESDADSGKIAITAPIARALIGKAVNDTVEVTTPKGKKSYEIVNVAYK
ncbi:MAG: transcription elongation factor GreA [Alphaproteobacteria bacterium]|nr:transcription elongation factor GreA [Alphaproteobacteria bacterium]